MAFDRLVNWDGPSAEEAARVADYEDLIVSIEPLDNPILWSHDQPVTIMYTSGTTGRPKGAIITQGMVLWNVINSTGFFKLRVDMTNLAFLPLFHTGGLNCFANPAFHYGGRNIIMRDFEPSLALEYMTVPDHGVTQRASG